MNCNAYRVLHSLVGEMGFFLQPAETFYIKVCGCKPLMPILIYKCHWPYYKSHYNSANCCNMHHHQHQYCHKEYTTVLPSRLNQSNFFDILLPLAKWNMIICLLRTFLENALKKQNFLFSPPGPHGRSIDQTS